MLTNNIFNLANNPPQIAQLLMDCELPQKRQNGNELDSQINLHASSHDIFRSQITKNPFTNRDIADMLTKDW